MIRVGLGQDSHWFGDKKKPLVLGGIKVADYGGLKANSDGDVILHALCNALSSAIGGDSLGVWADKMCLKKGITNSQEFVKEIMRKIKDQNYQVNNVAMAIEAKRPRISLATFQQMKAAISRLLEIKKTAVGITITSGEGLTAFGQGKAIQVFAMVTLKYEN